MTSLYVDPDTLIPGQRYIVTYYINDLKKNAIFVGNFNNATYGVINFYNVEGPDEMSTITGISRNNLVSIRVYTNPQLPGPINQQINSYIKGGKSKRRKSKRSIKYRLKYP